MIRDFARSATEIEGENYTAVAGAVGKGQGLNPKILRGALRGMIPHCIAGHPQGVIRGDGLSTYASAPSRGGRGRRRGIRRNKTRQCDDPKYEQGRTKGEPGILQNAAKPQPK